MLATIMEIIQQLHYDHFNSGSQYAHVVRLYGQQWRHHITNFYHTPVL